MDSRALQANRCHRGGTRAAVGDGAPGAALQRCRLVQSCAPVQAFEPRLTAELSGGGRDRVPAVLAFDEERGWLLLADAAGRSGSSAIHPEPGLLRCNCTPSSARGGRTPRRSRPTASPSTCGDPPSARVCAAIRRALRRTRRVPGAGDHPHDLHMGNLYLQRATAPRRLRRRRDLASLRLARCHIPLSRRDERGRGSATIYRKKHALRSTKNSRSYSDALQRGQPSGVWPSRCVAEGSR